MSDIYKLVQVLVERKVFDQSLQNLVSISTGLVAGDSVNADNAKAVGNAILTSMIGKLVAEYKFFQKIHVKTLASAIYVKTATGERIEMDPGHLYQRLLVMGVGEIPLPDLLRYELCCFPASLFHTNRQMRTGDKAELIHYILKLAPLCVVPSLPATGLQYVLVGGGLLHKFTWPKHITYAEICEMYVRHVKVSYGQALVILDGYHGPSTKDEAHCRRTGSEVGACGSVSGEMRLTTTKNAFLGNSANKQALDKKVSLLSTQTGMRITTCEIACSSSKEKPTAVIAEDSDVFKLLIHRANADFDLYMVMSKQIVSIKTLKKKLDPYLSRSLLFLHAISGCDTTSRPYGIGKVTVFKKVSALRNSVDTFTSPLSSKKDVMTAGENTLLEIYGCQRLPTMNLARVERF